MPVAVLSSRWDYTGGVLHPWLLTVAPLGLASRRMPVAFLSSRWDSHRRRVPVPIDGRPVGAGLTPDARGVSVVPLGLSPAACSRSRGLHLWLLTVAPLGLTLWRGKKALKTRAFESVCSRLTKSR
jgi:hypothetical protein